MCGAHRNSSGADVALWESPSDVAHFKPFLGVGDSKIFAYFELNLDFIRFLYFSLFFGVPFITFTVNRFYSSSTKLCLTYCADNSQKLKQISP